MIKILLITLLLFSKPAWAIMTVEEWEVQFLKYWQSEYNKCEPYSLAEDSWPGYSLAYCIDANTSMFLATGKSSYLDRALVYINNRIKVAKPSHTFQLSQYKDDYLTWVNHSHTELGDDGKEYPLFEAYLWRYVGHLLRVMRETDTIYSNPEYRSQYQEILDFTEKHIFQKWYSRGLYHIYPVRTHMASHWAYLTLELWHITTNNQLKSIYKDIYEKISSTGFRENNYSLKNQLIVKNLSPSVYFWNASWGSEAPPGQDVSHGNNVISYIVEAHALNAGWNDTELLRFKNTFNTIVWPQENQYAEYIDGSGTGNGWFSDGFSKLGRFDKNLQQRLEQIRFKRPWDTQFIGNGALNAKILLYPTKAWSQIYDLTPPQGFSSTSSVNNGAISILLDD